jgi:hypothetical protein
MGEGGIITGTGLRLDAPEPGDIVTVRLRGDGSWRDHVFEVRHVTASSVLLRRRWPRGGLLACPSPWLVDRSRVELYEASDLLAAILAEPDADDDAGPAPAREAVP